MGPRLMKPVAIAALGSVLVGFFLFGRDFFSYVRTSSRVVQHAVQEGVSVEFELQRARDLVDDILPKIQANVHLIAQDEVAIALLEKDIAASRENLSDQKNQLAGLRAKLAVQQVSYLMGDRELSRNDVAEQLSHRFDRYREAELILSSKERLLETRRDSLAAAMKKYERAKHQKIQLEQRIESLVAQHRLVQASSVGMGNPIEDVDTSRAERLLVQIQKRLDVSQRVVAHQAELVPIDLHRDEVDEADVLAEFDDYFAEQAVDSIVSNE